MKYITLNFKKYTKSRNPKISHTSNGKNMFQLIVLYVIVK